MMNLINDIQIQCETCGQIHTISKDLLVPNVYSYASCMGDELESTIDHSIMCDECQNEVRFVISGFEYPVGTYNYDEYEIHGGNFIRKPDMVIINSQEEFDVEAAYGEYDRMHDLILQTVEDRNPLHNITPSEFEKIVERIFTSEGFETQLPNATHDGDKGIIAIKHNMGKPVVFYVEYKQDGTKRTVDVNVVRSLYGVQTSDRKNKTILTTTSDFASEAAKDAEKQNTLIDLIDVDEFHEVLKRSAKRT